MVLASGASDTPAVELAVYGATKVIAIFLNCGVMFFPLILTTHLHV